MHRRQSAIILSAAFLALLGAGGATIQNSIAQPAAASESRDIRIGTVDIYLVSERIMQQEPYRVAREQGDAAYQRQLTAIEDELRQMETRLQALPQNDPQAQDIYTRAQTLQTDYQRIQQERQQELERINSRQLIDAFTQTRGAAADVARRGGYTHIISNRQFDRPIETTTVGATLQEMLARPVLLGIAQDDLTSQVLAELQLSAAPPAPPVPSAPATTPGGQTGAPNTGQPR
jgi:Skp family chaperone for outer membrane proteins